LPDKGLQVEFQNTQPLVFELEYEEEKEEYQLDFTIRWDPKENASGSAPDTLKADGAEVHDIRILENDDKDELEVEIQVNREKFVQELSKALTALLCRGAYKRFEMPIRLRSVEHLVQLSVDDIFEYEIEFEKEGEVYELEFSFSWKE